MLEHFERAKLHLAGLLLNAREYSGSGKFWKATKRIKVVPIERETIHHFFFSPRLAEPFALYADTLKNDDSTMLRLQMFNLSRRKGYETEIGSYAQKLAEVEPEITTSREYNFELDTAARLEARDLIKTTCKR